MIVTTLISGRDSYPKRIHKWTYKTNFYGVLRVGQVTLPAMRGLGRGHAVNINSLSGLLAVPFEGMYFASKYELEGMTEALRMELRPYG
jgi:short-subunit dehydrogenase